MLLPMKKSGSRAYAREHFFLAVTENGIAVGAAAKKPYPEVRVKSENTVHPDKTDRPRQRAAFV